MSNHAHTVLKINEPLAQGWSDEQVMNRWEQLFALPVLVERYQNGECHSEAEQNKACETINVFRNRLTDISWFMRCLNEPIARKANAEDSWLETVQGFSKGFHAFVGPEKQIKSLCKTQKKHWVRGLTLCRKLFKRDQPQPIST